MYVRKMLASIRVNNKILKEYKDTVYLPFGSEYQIRLKNLNTVRALANIYIDGENVTPNGLVLLAGQEVDFERSLANGSMTEGNKFKFIERTGKIEDHRGIKLEDGLIRVEFQFEKVYKRQDGIVWTNKLKQPYYEPYYGDVWPHITTSGTYTSTNNIATSMAMSVGSTASMASASLNNSALRSFNASPQTETGITVAGSKSEQKFATTSWFATEPEKHNIILKLLGETEDNKSIREPITVKHKQKCNVCGHVNKATAKFCGECGTALVIYA